jgi:methylenetetrahydrofolate dehydrogenase (NADP+)/methenyltetrahydrofolate cyclohydrolase
MAQIIDGKKLAQECNQRTAQEAEELKKGGVTPGLAVVLVGEHPASQVYVRNKEKACKKAGIDSHVHRLSDTTSEGELLELIHSLNQDQSVHGILVQLPLPKHIDQMRVIEAIDPAKDVDGFHPINTGRHLSGLPCFTPCTPSGIMALIDSAGVDPAGKRACVVGRSNIVGKPVAIMLLARHATVTICHSKTPDLDKEVGRADIVVAAIGRPQFIQGSWIKKGAVVIDVGISRTESGLVGDVDFEEASKRALAITPVPGGVGPMTIAMLLKNTVEAARRTLARK